jgi:NADH-quinone oxidoreductase subunit L
MLALIPLLPLAGFLFNATVGRRMSKRVSGGLATAVMFASFGVSISVVGRMLGAADHAVAQTVYEWIPSGDLNIPFTLRVDPLSALMILVVTGIGALIHLYSTSYMLEETDSEFARYFSYLNLFAAFMLVLVLGASFPVMFVGWEGVGLCSYLLIGFWFQKPSAADAGKKAFVVNRIGDVGFILGMLLTFDTFGTLDFQKVAGVAASMPVEATMGTLTIITLLLFVGATGKSAQIPLYVWLPDAMEGPTPVSALIHAATMVTRRSRSTSSPSSASRRLSWRARSGWSRPTSNGFSRTRRSRSSDICSWRWGSARTPPASSISTHTHSSRRCCSSGPAQSFTRSPASRICDGWAA